jgi:hypothetical protein
MSKVSPRPRLIATGDVGTQGCKGTNFPLSLYIYTHTHYMALEYVCEFVHYSRSKRRKQDQRMMG